MRPPRQVKLALAATAAIARLTKVAPLQHCIREKPSAMNQFENRMAHKAALLGALNFGRRLATSVGWSARLLQRPALPLLIDTSETGKLGQREGAQASSRGSVASLSCKSMAEAAVATAAAPRDGRLSYPGGGNVLTLVLPPCQDVPSGQAS